MENKRIEVVLSQSEIESVIDGLRYSLNGFKNSANNPAAYPIYNLIAKFQGFLPCFKVK